jgi:hypothetical protein
MIAMSKSKPNAKHSDLSKGGRDQYERHVDGSITVHGQVETHFPPDFVQAYNAENAAKTFQEKKNLRLSRLALLGVVISTGITAWMAYMTKEHFQIDQRPYVWSNGNIPPERIHIVPNEKMWISVAWVNYGKSPALKFTGRTKIFIGESAFDDAEKWFNQLGKGLPHEDGEGIVVPPGISPDITTTFGGFSSIESDGLLTQQQYDYIMNPNHSPFAAVVRVQYFDGHGKRYWSDMCLERLRNGLLFHCHKHNDIQ